MLEPPPAASRPPIIAHETTVRATAMLHPPWVCSCAFNGAFVPEKPPVASLDSNDYFISTHHGGGGACRVSPQRQRGLIVLSPRRAPHVACDKQRQYHIL
jgi:hypothetical protein